MTTPAVFLKFLVLFIPLFLVGQAADGCTTFVLKDEDKLVVAHNYDWRIDFGLVIVNKRGMVKSALMAPSQEPATWTSKYGSITFNQYGRELPQAGMNETGLVVTQMELGKAKFPLPDERPVVGSPQWLQYQLDNCRSVSEVTATASEIRINENESPVHYFVTDASGNVATIEFLEGKMVIHEADNMPIMALTNDTYADSIRHAKQFEGNKPVENITSSLDRFVQAGDRIKRYKEMKNIDVMDYAFETLQIVRQPITMWSIVFDVKNRSIRFRTMKSPAIKSLDFIAFDFSGATPCRVLDIHTKKPRDTADDFADYTTEINKNLVYESWRSTPGLMRMSDATLDMVAAYPETIKYVEEAGEKE